MKALAVLVVALALGVYLVDIGGPHTPASASSRTSSSGSHSGSHTPSGTPGTTTPTTQPATTTTSPGGAHPSSTVKVLVANASQTNGIAAYYSSKLSAAGWGTLVPVTAAASETSSTIYYATGDQADALAIAATLGVASSAVEAMAAGVVPVNTTGNAQVVVLAGDDLAAKVPSTSG